MWRALSRDCFRLRSKIEFHGAVSSPLGRVYARFEIHLKKCQSLQIYQPARDRLLKDGPVQVGPIIEFLEAVPDSTPSSKQMVPHPSKHNLHKCIDLDPESTV